ncbi:MAG: hypothetical protein ACYC5M_18095, partial [Anaerolineae bacterium]
VCTLSGQLATDFCPTDTVEERDFHDYGAAFDEWAHAQGYTTPPREACTAHSAPSRVSIQAPPDPLSGVIEIRGSTDIPDFDHYMVEYGVSDNPGAWGRLTPDISASVIDGVLCRWDTATVDDGVYSLRVVAISSLGVRTEARVVVTVRNATPTPDVTETPTETPTVTPTWTPEPTGEPTNTPTETIRPTETLAPTATTPATATPTVAAATATPDGTALPPPPPGDAEIEELN